MSRQIFRYVLPINDTPTTLEARFTANDTVTALPSRTAFDEVDIWLETDPTMPMTKRVFQIAGTGHPLPEDFRWVATVPGAMNLIWHVLEGVVPE